MSEGLKFSTPQQELEYLRSKVLEAEKKLESAGGELERVSLVHESIAEFKKEAGIGATVVYSTEVERDADNHGCRDNGQDDCRHRGIRGFTVRGQPAQQVQGQGYPESGG